MKKWSGLCLALLLLWQGAAQASCHLASPTSLPAPSAHELLIATQNLWLFHDESQDFRYDQAVPRQQVDARIDALAGYIIHRLAAPHLLAVQEVENRKLLERLTAAIRAQGGPDYQINFLPNRDEAGNAVALLSRAPVQVAHVQALFDGLTVEARRNSPLFARLPLLVTVTAPLPMQVLVVHLRSAHGLEAGDERFYVQSKRHGQAQALIRWARQHQGNYLVLGDFNSGPGGGDFALPWQTLKQAGWQEAQAADADTNYSYVFRCRKQQLDHVFLSQGLQPLLAATGFVHGNAGHFKQLYSSEGTEVVSDHDGLGVYLKYP